MSMRRVKALKRLRADFGPGQAESAMALEIAMQRRARRVSGLRSVEAVVQWRKGVAAEGDNGRLILG